MTLLLFPNSPFTLGKLHSPLIGHEFLVVRAHKDGWSIRQETLVKSTVVASSFFKGGLEDWKRATTYRNIKDKKVFGAKEALSL